MTSLAWFSRLAAASRSLLHSPSSPSPSSSSSSASSSSHCTVLHSSLSSSLHSATTQTSHRRRPSLAVEPHPTARFSGQAMQQAAAAGQRRQIVDVQMPEHLQDQRMG
ncbi:unnamed protein product [Closterium sp. NIES-53]